LPRPPVMRGGARRSPAAGPQGYAARQMDGRDAAGGDPFQEVARFISVDPTKKRFRFYELRLQATLWGGGAMGRAWGRLGAPGRRRVREYPDPAAAGPEVERAGRRRLPRGYRLLEARRAPATRR